MLPVLFAPLQGVTDHVFRKAYEAVFAGVEEYYTPFIRWEHGSLRNKDAKELAVLAEEPKTVVQLLPANRDQAVCLANEVRAKGYSRADINMGCPFPKIVHAGAGAGLLENPQRVKEVLSVANEFPDIKFSLKLRCGLKCSDELWQLTDIINGVCLHHVTLHPRTAGEGYEGNPDLEVFGRFVRQCCHKVVYNGNITSLNDIIRIEKEFPGVGAVMVGRGLAGRPDMLAALDHDSDKRRALCSSFYNRIYEAYARLLCGETQLLMKMQSFWQFFLPDADRKLKKKIQKTNSLAMLEECARRIIAGYPFA